MRVSDTLVRANTLANATVEQFSEALTNRAGASLRTLNKDLEEGVAVLAAYADQGVKGSMAGEQLAIVIRDLQNASLRNNDAFVEAGIAVFDASGDMRNFADIIQDLEGRLGGLSDAQLRAELTTLGFQDRSIAALLTLLGTSDAIRTYEMELRSAAGVTEDIAERQLDTFTSQLSLLKSGLADIALELGDQLLPALRNVVEALKLFTAEADGIGKIEGIEFIGDQFAALSERITEANALQELIDDPQAFGQAAAAGEEYAGLLNDLRTELNDVNVVAGIWLGQTGRLKEVADRYGLSLQDLKELIFQASTAHTDMWIAQQRVEAAVARTREGLLLANPAFLEFAGGTDLSNQSVLEFTTGIAQLLTYSGRYRIALQSIGDELPDTVIGTEALIPPTQQLANDFSTLGVEAAAAAVEVRNLNNAVSEGAGGAGFEGQESLLFGEGPAAGAALARARAVVDARRDTGGGGGGGSRGPSSEQIADLERARDLGDEFGGRWAAAYALVQQAQSAYNESLNEDFDLNIAVVEARGTARAHRGSALRLRRSH